MLTGLGIGLQPRITNVAPQLPAAVGAVGVTDQVMVLGGDGVLRRAPVGALARTGFFWRPGTAGSCLAKTGATALSIAAGTAVEVGGVVIAFAAETPVVMPALVAGTDYAVYVCGDGAVRADPNFSAPPGYTAADSRRIGGFHFDPGSEIAQYSVWDLRWRPACPDPRGMVLVAGRFWCDIYLLGVNHVTDGTSRAGATIADGSSPPKIPVMFGGTGSTAYGGLNWWAAAEVLTAAGKRMPTYAEFSAAAYGVAEAESAGADPVTTQRQAGRTSVWGVEQAAGVMWVWGADFSYWPGAGTAGWNAQAGGRGNLFLANDSGLVAALFGGNWLDGGNAGSRASHWSNVSWLSSSDVGARGLCDHLNLGGVA